MSIFAPIFAASPRMASARFAVSFTARMPWSVHCPKMMYFGMRLPQEVRRASRRVGKGMPASRELRELALDDLGDAPEAIELEASQSLAVVSRYVERLKGLGVQVCEIDPADVLESLHALIVVVRRHPPRALDEHVRELDQSVERGLEPHRRPTAQPEFRLGGLGRPDFLGSLPEEGLRLLQSLRNGKGPLQGSCHATVSMRQS